MSFELHRTWELCQKITHGLVLMWIVLDNMARCHTEGKWDKYLQWGGTFPPSGYPKLEVLHHGLSFLLQQKLSGFVRTPVPLSEEFALVGFELVSHTVPLSSGCAAVGPEQ